MIEQSEALVLYDSLPLVRGRESHYTQLFQNLISNAIKYRSERPLKVIISADRIADEWRVSVSDNGIGIQSQYREQIFGVFKRLHGRDISGAGIGLAICQRIVERLKGRIWVESEPQQGSTFFFTIPVGEH